MLLNTIVGAYNRRRPVRAARVDGPADGYGAVREPHAQWLYRRGVDSAVLVDRELLVRPAPQRTVLGHALNLPAGAALRFRDCFGSTDPVWSLMGFFANGYFP